MKKIYTVCLSVALGLTLNVSSAQTEVTFYTTKGTFVATMYDTLQPITAGNFISLVNAKFYDGIIFHRVINNFVIQGGDPTGTGTGGCGYTINDEFDSRAKNVQKALGMANSGPNTGGSQFFINLVSNTYLDPNYPVFGIVKSNFPVVQTIGAVATDANDKPLVPVVMDSVRVTQAYVTGIEEVKNKPFTVTIFPNPAHSYIIVDMGTNYSATGGYKIKITNLLGEMVYTASLHQEQTVIDLSVFSGTGIYFMRITDIYNNEINRKIIKQ